MARKKEVILVMNHRTKEYWVNLPGGRTIHFPSAEAWVEACDFFQVFTRWAGQTDKPFPSNIRQIDLHKED